MNLEGELRKALRRHEPPAGFEERVLARLDAEPEPPVAPRVAAWVRSCWNPRAWAPALAAFALLLLMVGQLREQHRQRAIGEKASRELVYALDLAASKLTYAQQRALEPRIIRLERLEKR